MKLLFLGVNQEYFNNMHSNYRNAFVEIVDVTFYGPGFSDSKVLELGLFDFYRQTGPYDAVICTFSLLQKSIELYSIRDIYYFHRDFMSYYEISEAIRYTPGILEDFENIKNAVKLIYYNGDMVTMPDSLSAYYSRLLEKDAYIISPGREFVSDIKENVTFAGVKANTVYKDFIERYQNKVISLVPCAATLLEYDFTPLRNRKYDFVFPGIVSNEYPNRMNISAILRKEHYIIYDDHSDRAKGHRTESRYPSVYSLPNRRSEDIAYWREEFHVSLKSAKCAYTDGSNVKAIVRKYFEIPARGTILFCDDVPGIKEMGFKDGVNMVLVDENNVKDKVKELFDNEKKMEQIAAEGFNLVSKNHTAHKRAMDTVTSIERILSGKFNGTAWNEGKLMFM